MTRFLIWFHAWRLRRALARAEREARGMGFDD